MGNIERRYDMDWLRVLAMHTIFLFHCARFFNYEDWNVKNNSLYPGMSVFVEIESVDNASFLYPYRKQVATASLPFYSIFLVTYISMLNEYQE